MALTFRITKARFDKLDDETKEHYAADGDKHYKLDVEGLDDAGELKRAKERAEETVAELKDEVKTITKERDTLKSATTDGGADVQRLTRSHERKIATLTEEHTARLTARDSFIRKTLIDNTATALATEISTVPALMTDHIKKRLSVDFEGDEPKLVILDKDGKPAPALKIEALKQEVLTDPQFKAILVGSKATGSAAQRGNASPAVKGAAPTQDGSAEAADVNALSGKSFTEKVRAAREARQQAAGAT